MLWLLLWLPLCAYFLLPKLGLLGTLLLVDRLIPSFELLRRNSAALLARQPVSAALARPPRLASYDRCTLFALCAAAYQLALLALHAERQLWLELALCSVTLPPLQPRLLARLGVVVAWRDARAKRLAAKLVVRAIRALSEALLGQAALVRTQDVLPFVDRAPELVWQVCKHGAMTLLLLYVKRYSQRSYYTLLKYAYYYQTAQLRRRPSAEEARRKLIALLDAQRWEAFALDGRTFGLVMVLFHQGDPNAPQWIALLNFAAARFLAVWTLAQALHAWEARWAPLACAAALLLVQRAELEAYWRTCAAAALGAALIGVDAAPLWLGALVSTSRPLWFGVRSAARFAAKRLRYAAALRLPAYWLLSAALLAIDRRAALPLLAYAATLSWYAPLGTLGLLLLGLRSAYALAHLLACALCFGALYTLLAYSLRPPPAAARQPKVSAPPRFRMIENYKPT